MKFIATCVLALILTAGVAGAAEPPAPYGAVPTERHLRWHELEVYGFIHFTVNTFTDREWGNGDEPESVFNPTDFDAEQIVQTVKAAGMKGLMLTCKHHDGFCLWPSKYTEHSVKNSPWKGGKGDMVREISDACRRHGLKFGVYLSPWDRNHKDYARPEYVTYFHNQLRELLTQYGPIYEVWFDGANGGDGYYGGARERRQIDSRTYYQWDTTWKIVRELQPMACMFNGGDVRWVGNERGFAGETCWVTVNRSDTFPYAIRSDLKLLNAGQRGGSDWVPAEVDVSIRPGWFYHESEDGKVKTVAQLVKIYFESVGRGCNLILNLPPDRRGQIPEKDVATLRQWRQVLDETFATDLARGAKATASNTRGEDARFAPGNTLDDKRETYWTTDDAVKTPELVLDLGRPVTFNVVRVREHLPLGQRVDSIALDAWQEGAWTEFGSATSIGSQRLVLSRPMTTAKVRLRITAAAVCPAISEVGLFMMPVLLNDPRITRDAKGMVTIENDGLGTEVRYTMDGTAPAASSPLYEQPFGLTMGGTVKACAFLKGEARHSGVAEAVFGVAPAKWRIVGADTGEKRKAIDVNPKTIWDSAGQGAPQEIVIDLGQSLTLKGITCLPRQYGGKDGIVDRYEVYVGEQAQGWGAPAAAGEFANIKANPVEQTVTFARPVRGRYVRFVATHVAEGSGVTLAEVGVIAVP